MAVGAGFGSFKPDVVGGEEWLHIGVKIAFTGLAINVRKGEGSLFGSSIYPGTNQVYGIDVAVALRHRYCRRYGCCFHTSHNGWAVAVSFLDVELPAGGHPVVAQAGTKLRMLPIPWCHNRHARWLG